MYRSIMKFYFNKEKYEMFLDNKNKHFFLKIDENGNYNYLTIGEYVVLISYLTYNSNSMCIRKDEKKKKHIVPIVLIGGVATVLTSSILFESISSMHRINNITNNTSIEKTYDYSSTSDEIDEDKELIVDTYRYSETGNTFYVYDNDYLSEALGYDTVSVDVVKNVIKNNPNISDKFKNLLYSYIDRVVSVYPNTDFRILYENCKTLVVNECTKDELMIASVSVDSYATYVRTENKIYTLKEYDYEPGTWNYQVIFHELSHALRVGEFKNSDGIRVVAQGEGNNFFFTTLNESLNSLFTVSLFDYEEKDIAYQLQSNTYKLLIDNMDNYSLEDYLKYSNAYFAKQLGEYIGEDEAVKVIQLIDMQYKDFHSTILNADQSEYYPIYDCVMNIYFQKHITSDMSYSDAKKVLGDMIDQMLYDVPEEYNIDTNHFYDYLNEYCTNLGINTNVSVR